MKYLKGLSILILALAIFVPYTAEAKYNRKRAQVFESTQVLTQASKDFYTTTFNLPGYRRMSANAEQFLKGTRRFKRKIRHGAPPKYLMNEYYELKASFSALDRSFTRAHAAFHHWGVLKQWYDVKWAWERLSWTVEKRKQGNHHRPYAYNRQFR